MSLDATNVFGAMTIGIGATLVTDLWNLFLKHAFNIPSLNYCLLGRLAWSHAWRHVSACEYHRCATDAL